MVPACNATQANFDNGTCRLSLGDSVVILAPKVACTVLQHRTRCIHAQKARGTAPVLNVAAQLCLPP